MAVRYINPFTDFGFKRLFGEKAHKDLLISFLNALLKDAGEIKDLTYLKNEQVGRSEKDRRAIFDIFCENQAGEKFIVEMQKAKQNYFKDRSVFYSTFPIQQQGLQGPWDFELKAVYTIGILDFVFDENKDNEDYFHWEVKLMETTKKTVFYDKLTFIYLEMPKFKKTLDELETAFDKWMYVLKNLPDLMKRPIKLQEKVFGKLFKVAELSQLRYEEYLEYEDSLKVYRDNQNVLDTAISEGYQSGFNKGINVGIEKGIEQGIEKGIAQVVLNAHKRGLDNNSISDITGLKIEQIEVIISKNNSSQK